jgi:starch phosphorylase
VEAVATDPMHVGAELPVRVRVSLGHLAPDDVEVQLYHGVLDSHGEIAQPHTVVLASGHSPEPSNNGSKVWQFSGKIACRASGQYGYCVRVLPKNAALQNLFEPGLVTWG